MAKHRKKTAYSLIEMSFVILGLILLIVGVMTGITLMRQAQLRTVITEVSSLITSIKAFQLKYNYLPGDFIGAFTLWGTQCDVVAADCNGNGNGILDLTPSGTNNESLRFWQHLRLSGILYGPYIGKSPLNPPTAELGINTPKSKAFAGAGYSAIFGTAFSNVENVIYKRGPLNFLKFGKVVVESIDTNGSVINGDEASSIDLKMDDGYPEYGQINGYDAFNIPPNNCIIGVIGKYEYDLNNENKNCHLLWHITD
jgi:hypothetical protein